MTDPGTWDAVEVKEDSFEALLAGAICPPPGLMLLAIEAELQQVDAAAVSFRLDELARGLFESAEPGTASHQLATLLTDELCLRTDESSTEGMWLDVVLARHAGHPLAAVLAAEIGRRAGLAVGVCSTPSGPIRRHCGHEVGFAALTGIYARMIRDGEGARACHAAQLRGRLPVGRHA